MIGIINRLIGKKFYNILFSVIFSILILMSFLSSYLVLSRYISKTDNRKLQSTNNYLEETTQSYRELHHEIDILYSFLLRNNPSVLQYLTASQSSELLKEDALQSLKEVSSLNSYISSVVLYNHTAEAYLCDDSTLDMKLFLKMFLKNSINNLPAQANQRVAFIYHHPESASESNPPTYLSVVYYILNRYTQTYYSVVFNLNAEKIQTEILRTTQENVFLVNEFASVLASYSQRGDIRNIPLSWLRNISAGTSNGTFEEKIKNTNFLISYREIDSQGWYCFTIDKSSKDLLHSPYLFILLCIINVSISLALSRFLAQQLYAPFHNTLGKLVQIAGTSEIETEISTQVKNDEFAYVTSIVSALSDKVQNLTQENTNNMELLKIAFLKTLIQEGGTTLDLQKAWQLYSIQLFGPEIYLLLIEADHLINDEPSKDFSFFAILQTGLHNFLADHCSFEIIPRNKIQYVVLYTPKTSGTEYQLPRNILTELQEFISITTGIGVTIVLEGNCYPAARLYEGYRNAIRMLKERFVLGYGKIISKQELTSSLSVMTAYPDALIKEILDSVKQRNKETFLKHYDELVIFLSLYIYQDVIRVLIHLVNHMADVMRSITLDSQYLNIDFSSIDELFHSVYTVQETRGWFEHFFDQYLDSLQEYNLNKNDKYWEIVKQVQELIQENFADPNLSIESISEIVGYTSNYFSKIFKKLTGVYLKDYIKNVRISHAISLLIETELTVNEISSRTGFVNQNYFFAAFKKETGMTPSMYRQIHKVPTDEF